MAQSSTPTQPPAPEMALPLLKDMLDMDYYTCVTAFVLLTIFIIIITRFRLSYTNSILKKISGLKESHVSAWLSTSIGFAVAYQQQNDLYLIWVVLLLVVYDNDFTASYNSLLDQASDRRTRDYVFLYNCIIIGICVFQNERKRREFYLPLLVLWSSVVTKFFIRILCYIHAEKAYGLENTNLIADYMKSEHKLTDTRSSIDPTCMQGYKYLVLGEDKIETKIEAPDYTSHIKLGAHVVTVERVWSCKAGLLDPSIDKYGHLKDVCLSFALFKLLRRQYFGYPAAEAHQDKTKQLVFSGLLAANITGKGEVDKERVFRIIKVELGFLRDLFFTRYPISFAMGCPGINLALVVLRLGVTIWIATKVLQDQNPTSYYLYFVNKNVDFPITIALLILIAVMEIFEALAYIFSDWTKVILICRNVRSHVSHVASQLASSEIGMSGANHWKFGYKVLAYFCNPSFSTSVENRIGQYSLLNTCNKVSMKRARRWSSFISTCSVSKLKEPPRRLKKSTVKFQHEVKNLIFDTLVQSQCNPTNGMAALQRNGVSVYEDLQWTLNLGTPVHTIMVWHIATSFCEIKLVKDRGNKGLIEADHKVATQLSNYCAYLVAFFPDLLPSMNSNSVKYMFWQIFDESSEFFHGASKPEAKLERMMKCTDGGEKIIDRGAELGRYFINKISDDVQRWKIMADFWSEYILHLAPSGSARVHIEQLSNGSEFITHLWALLYHAGISGTASTEYQP